MHKIPKELRMYLFTPTGKQPCLWVPEGDG
jgi:hypothetical protein